MKTNALAVVLLSSCDIFTVTTLKQRKGSREPHFYRRSFEKYRWPPRQTFVISACKKPFMVSCTCTTFPLLIFENPFATKEPVGTRSYTTKIGNLKNRIQFNSRNYFDGETAYVQVFLSIQTSTFLSKLQTYY